MTFHAQSVVDRFLHTFESESSGCIDSFSLQESSQAIKALRTQGRLSQTGPLPLFSALFTHLNGQSLKFDAGDWSLAWEPSLGPLQESVLFLLGCESLAVQGVDVALKGSRMTFSSPRGVETVEAVFHAFWDRLVHFPWDEQFRPSALSRFSKPLVSTQVEGYRLDFYPPPSEDPFGVLSQPPGRFLQVVQGIAYPRKWRCPVDAVLHDREGRADYSHIVIPDTARRDRLIALAVEQFQSLSPAPARPSQPLLTEQKMARDSTTAEPLPRNQAARVQWLERHRPGEPDWLALSHFREDGHGVSRAETSGDATQVHFWREGRPFGSLTLDPEACRPGFVIVWVEDGLPANLFWNGPEFSAVLTRFPEFDDLCRKADAALPEREERRQV